VNELTLDRMLKVIRDNLHLETPSRNARKKNFSKSIA